MPDRPIIFSAPMIKALLAGRKSMTRRVFKWQGPKGYPHSWEHAKVDNPAGVQRLLVPYNHPEESDMPWWENGAIRHYGPADPGDRLWVREVWQDYCPLWHGHWCGHGSKDGIIRDHKPVYRADPEDAWLRGPEGGQGKPLKWRSPIHMPRWASRLTLTVTDVRVQRLQEISEEDAIAEGCPCRTPEELAGMEARGWFRDLWNSIHSPDAWDANPWVCVLRFTVEHRNIDQAA